MKVDETARTVEVSFSSEEPVDRYWGLEILDHASKSCDLARLKSAGPVLMDHNRRDQVGVVEKVWIEDKVGRAVLRFGKGARAQEIWTDILDGIRRNVSVSYSIDKVVLESEENGVSTYRIQRWCPEEISIVSVPADTSVGVGRADEANPNPNPSPSPSTIMNRQRIIAALTRAGVTFDQNATDEELAALLETTLAAGRRSGAGNGNGRRSRRVTGTLPTAVAEGDDEGDDEGEGDDDPPPARTPGNAVAAERNRQRDILKLYREHNVAEIDPDGAVLEEYQLKDHSVERFQRWILENRYVARPLNLDPRIHNDPRLHPENQGREGQIPQGGVNRIKTAPNGYPLLGSALTDHPAYRAALKAGGNKRGISIEIPGFLSRATLTTGSLTSFERPPGVVLLEQQPLSISMLFSQGQTTAQVVRVLKETAYTQAATAVAEEGQKPEATFSLAEADFPVEKVAVIGRVTDEMFADFPVTRDYVNQRLMYMQESKEEDLLLNGNGSTPQITGVLQTVGIQTQAAGANPLPDYFHNAITKVRAIGFFEPDYLVMNPFDWEIIALGKDQNGQYYGGGPFSGPYGVGPYTVAGRLWGKPVVATTAMAQGTGLVGSFKLGGQVWRRDGIRIDTTNSDASDFVYNRIAIRVEGRMALALYRPLAFCTVTGIV